MGLNPHSATSRLWDIAEHRSSTMKLAIVTLVGKS